jgi:hypothetical protein
MRLSAGHAVATCHNPPVDNHPVPTPRPESGPCLLTTHNPDRLTGARLRFPSHQRLNIHRAAVAIRPPQMCFIKDVDGIDR